MNEKLTVRDICMIGMFTALIVVFSWITIPMPLGVPITFQTFIIPLTGIILGPKKGTTSVLIYILLGVIGLPVFAGFKGGLGVLFGQTGGFIWGFLFMAFFAGLGANKDCIWALIIGLLIGIIIDYALGMVQFMFVSGSDLKTSFFATVVPFIPLQIVKTILAAFLGVKCKKILTKNGFIRSTTK